MAILHIDRFEGMNNKIAGEKSPVYLFPKIVNLEFSSVDGHLRKRKGYAVLISTGLTALSNFVEFVDKNDSRQILLLDGTTLKEIPYSGGYGAVASITNDERTAGSTVNTFKPVKDRNEIRSGAGINASTDRPFWYGYIPERDRFNDAVTITAGRYLDEQDALNILKNCLIIEMTNTTSDIVDKTDAGLDQGYYTVYIAPVIDKYQRGLPTNDPTQLAAAFVTIKHLNVNASNKTFQIKVFVDSLDVQKFKRVTAIDIYVAYSNNSYSDFTNSPAYFLERVDFNDDGETILEIEGDVGSTTANKITISSAASWRSFNPVGLFIHDVTNDDYYRVTAYTLSGADGELTVTPNAPANGSATLRFLSRWYANGLDYEYKTFFDNDLKKLGAEMYTDLGIPSGDEGVADFRYKFGAMAGKRFFACGFSGEEKNYLYYSIANSPDVLPVQNLTTLRQSPTGIIDLGDESVMVFYKNSADRIEVYGNQNHRHQSIFLNYGCTNHDSIVKINDDVIAWMDYTGPVLLQGLQAQSIGDPIRDWWDNQLSDAEKEACVSLYDRLNQRIIFSFPTYSTSPYTAGICFVFDLKALQDRKVSAWYILHSDVALKSGTLADDLHMLSGNGTAIHDWNNASPSETFDTTLRLKIVQNPILAALVNAEKLRLSIADGGSNTITLNLYIDGASSASLTVTANTGQSEAIFEYIGETFELEFVSNDGSDDFTFKSAVMEYEVMDK